MPLQALDETLDYEERALRAEQNAKVAETLHLAVLWRELATTYRELAERRRTIRPGRTIATGDAIEGVIQTADACSGEHLIARGGWRSGDC